ncbi:amidohydrolase family protein [Paraburkholderia sediminicola]|uniref:amidohydrolase family protein n=1 Tax=Paraburkholderia sediminicola TaxID=458836 RepID=UPI0038BA4115
MTGLSNFIDVHSHAILNIGRGAPLNKQPEWSVESALSFMDRYEIAACVLSVPDAANFGVGHEVRDVARRINEILADAVAKHPTRFGAMATLPAQDADDALAEMTYALDVLKMDGVSTSTSINEIYLGEAKFDPWFEEMNRRGVTLFIHPTMTETSLPLSIGLNPSVIEFMFDTTRMLTNMISTGAKKRFSKIKMISTHGGGALPYLVSRIQTIQHSFGVGPGRLELTPEEIFEGFSSFYYDLTAVTSRAQLGAITELVPPSQLLMGLDYPFMPETSFAPAIASIEGYAGFDDLALKQISYENACRLYPALKERLGIKL